jgi:hypothetical protein
MKRIMTPRECARLIASYEQDAAQWEVWAKQALKTPYLEDRRGVATRNLRAAKWARRTADALRKGKVSIVLMQRVRHFALVTYNPA